VLRCYKNAPDSTISKKKGKKEIEKETVWAGNSKFCINFI
jgi:hypothetical protein